MPNSSCIIHQILSILGVLYLTVWDRHRNADHEAVTTIALPEKLLQVAIPSNLYFMLRLLVWTVNIDDEHSCGILVEDKILIDEISTRQHDIEPSGINNRKDQKENGKDKTKSGEPGNGKENDDRIKDWRRIIRVVGQRKPLELVQESPDLEALRKRKF
ncbi:hypothetical protein ACH5RR_007146 [Cinchona calisaya]|uniref:Uncharacterized protein n=1 Tax=Cinchona calisaya TaxID=153742 RepID=A0ABD3AR07_9GENT